MTEQIILTEHEDAVIQDSHGRVVTHQRVIIDGDRDKEVVLLSPTAGASSEAPANSGIPSAVIQRHLRREAFADQRETPMSGRLQKVHEDGRPWF
jgi:hypothetical protein